MTTQDFITELFCIVDDRMAGVYRHPQAMLWPSETVTLGLLFALKGVGTRQFHRWIARDCTDLFPDLPHRTRLFRLLRTHQDWTDLFLASPSLLGVIDSYGIEMIHPVREGRSLRQRGRKGRSNSRWIVGGKLGLVLNHLGLVCAWECDTANVSDIRFQHLAARFEEEMVVLGDTAFHASTGDPSNLKLCRRGEWNDRMLVETVLSMLTVVCHLKKVTHRAWSCFRARLAFTMAVFNVLAQWDGLRADENGKVHLSIARFSL